jgi:hypothetical protein
MELQDQHPVDTLPVVAEEVFHLHLQEVQGLEVQVVGEMVEKVPEELEEMELQIQAAEVVLEDLLALLMQQVVPVVPESF